MNNVKIRISPAAKKARQDILNEARGYFAETFDITECVGQSTIGAGTQRMTQIPLYAGEVVNNIIIFTSTAGSGTAPTLFKLGLYKPVTATTANLVGETADLSADAGLSIAGPKAYALTAAYTVPTTGIYYAAVAQVGAFASTAWQCKITNTSSAAAPVLTGFYSIGLNKASLTDIAASGVFSLNSGTTPWFAVS